MPLEEINEELRSRIRKYFIVFIDYLKAFDLIKRANLLKKVKGMVEQTHHLCRIIENILTFNQIKIYDGVSTSSRIKQPNGVLHGDPLSPLFFKLVTAGIIKILENSSTTNLIMFADNMALGSPNKEELQAMLQNLERWAIDNSRPWWSSGYYTRLWIRGLRVQTRPGSMDFFQSEKI